MSTAEANLEWAAAFVDEQVRAGLQHVCVSPGSRSTPLAVAFAEHPEVRVWMHLDERSGAYFALGLAKTTRRPVAVLCTSGTAAANFSPAVVEARYGRVPLVMLTADRPSELRDVGAPQAIDQSRLYGVNVKWFSEPALPEATPAALRHARAVAARAFAAARACPAGPVHLNIPFREPFLPEAPYTPSCIGARDAGRPYTRVEQGAREPGAALVARLATELPAHRRGLIVCGPQDDPNLASSGEALARRLGWPILADPLSGLRCGVHDRSLVVDAYDVFLRSEEWAHSHEPEVVIRFGASPVSKVLVQFLSQNEATRLTVVDAGGEWLDPMLGASEMLHVDPVALCDALTEEITGDDAPPGEWAAAWVEANELTREALSEGLAELEELFEGRVCADLADALPDGSLLYVGNSMPVRDVDSFVRSSGKRIRLLGNRGASGIDGVVSSALGASAAGEGPVVLLIGDVSFYHDMNGLLASRLYGLELTVVLLNNDGGGIFSFLPQATRTRHFEELFGAPHGLDFSQGAAMYGAEYTLIQEHTELAPALQAAMGSGGLTVLEVCTDRARNVELHRALTDRAVRAVATAVRGKAVEAL